MWNINKIINKTVENLNEFFSPFGRPHVKIPPRKGTDPLPSNQKTALIYDHRLWSSTTKLEL
jgi:hypothetical protein